MTIHRRLATAVRHRLTVTRSIVSRRPRTIAAATLLLGVVVLSAAGAGALVGGTSAPAVGQPATFTIRTGWTLAELVRRIEAGDVEAVTAAAAPANGAPSQVLARTRSGDVVTVDLAVSAGEAIGSLNAMGYADLLTTEALVAARPLATPTSPLSSIVSIVSIVTPLGLLLLTVVLVVRLSRQGPSTGRDAEASRTLVGHLETLRRLAAYLVEHERLDRATFDELWDGLREVPTAGDEWRAATSPPRAWGDVVDLAGHRAGRLPSGAASSGPDLQPVPAAAATVATSVDATAAMPTSLAAAEGTAEGGSVVAAVVAGAVDVEAVIATPFEPDAPAAPAAERSSSTDVARGRRRPIRRSAIRRVRGLAAGALHRAEDWLRSGELEADRL